MRILFVIHYPNFGGPHNRALVLNKILISKGYKTVVVIPEERGDAYQRLTAHGIEVYKISLHRARANLHLIQQAKYVLCFFPEVWKLRNIIRDHDIDLVLVGGLINPHAAIAASLERVPLVWQILDIWTPMILRIILFPLVKLLSDAVMCVGLAVARKHPGVISLGPRIHLHYPPVNIDRFKPNNLKRNITRANLCVDETTFLIGTVGNLIPLKGHEYLIKATHLVMNKYRKIRLCIFGRVINTHAAYADFLNKEAKNAGFDIGKNFEIIDPDDKVPELLQGLDCFVSSSISEAMPTTILEAMACAVPVIATNVGSISEVVLDGETGIIVPPRDQKSIADAIIHLLCRRRLRRIMGLNGRLRVLRHFGLFQCAQSHIEAFEYAIRKNKRKR